MPRLFQAFRILDGLFIGYLRDCFRVPHVHWHLSTHYRNYSRFRSPAFCSSSPGLTTPLHKHHVPGRWTAPFLLQEPPSLTPDLLISLFPPSSPSLPPASSLPMHILSSRFRLKHRLQDNSHHTPLELPKLYISTSSDVYPVAPGISYWGPTESKPHPLQGIVFQPGTLRDLSLYRTQTASHSAWRNN